MDKFEGFCETLKSLEEACQYEEPYENTILAGIVGLYSLCFELAWRAMQERLIASGFSESRIDSARQVIDTGALIGMIKDKSLWLDAVKAKNNVARAYRKEVSLEIAAQTKDHFYRMFCDLKEELEQNWI